MILAVALLAASKYLKTGLELVGASGMIWGKSLISLLIVPLGISFMTFEAISYFIDIHRGDAEAGSFLDVALFLSLYPKLISGPIVLWKDFAPQVREHPVRADRVHAGLRRVAIGYAKKVLLADAMGAVISSITTSLTTGVDTETLWLRAILYMFQLYYDFAGYSDIAIGLMEILGFSSKENFDSPYSSLSVSEFWRRWHISLGSWFREYVYIPMGGSRKGNVYFHLFVVFLLTGLWHGSNWTFFIWGALHGIMVVLERLLGRTKLYRETPWIIKWLVTQAFVAFAWILFMSEDIQTAWNTILSMFLPGRNTGYNWSLAYFLTPKTVTLLLLGGVLSVAGRFRKLMDPLTRFLREKTVGILLGDAVCLALMALSIVFIVNSSYSPFLYFQF